MYNLYVWWNDTLISDFTTIGDDPQGIYTEFSDGLLRAGLKQGLKLQSMKLHLIEFCDKIYKQKINCEKIKATDHFAFLSAYFALHKLNHKDTFDNYMFLKIKSTPRNRTHHVIS